VWKAPWRGSLLEKILLNYVAAKSLRHVCIQAALCSAFCTTFGDFCNMKSELAFPGRGVAMLRMVLLLLHPSSSSSSSSSALMNGVAKSSQMSKNLRHSTWEHRRKQPSSWWPLWRPQISLRGQQMRFLCSNAEFVTKLSFHFPGTFRSFLVLLIC
jgi:hypothetical protein